MPWQSDPGRVTFCLWPCFLTSGNTLELLRLHEAMHIEAQKGLAHTGVASPHLQRQTPYMLPLWLLSHLGQYCPWDQGDLLIPVSQRKRLRLIKKFSPSLMSQIGSLGFRAPGAPLLLLIPVFFPAGKGHDLTSIKRSLWLLSGD